MSDFLDRLIARAHGDTLRVDPVLPSWFSLNALDVAPVENDSVAAATAFMPEADQAAQAEAVRARAERQPAESQPSDTRARAHAGPAVTGQSDQLPVGRAELPRQPFPRAAAPAPPQKAALEPLARAATAPRTPEHPRSDMPGAERAPEPGATTRMMPMQRTRVPVAEPEQTGTPQHRPSGRARAVSESTNPIASLRSKVEPLVAPVVPGGRMASQIAGEHEPERVRGHNIVADADGSVFARAVAASPTIQITIGRVELRAQSSPARTAQPPAPQRAQPALSLDEYLRQRAAGGSP